MIGNLLGGMLNKGAILGDFESIATVTIGSGGASNAEFTSIPSTFQHLQIRCLTRTSDNNTAVYIQFNNDTGSNYAYHYLGGNGASVSAGASINQTKGYIADTANNSSGASRFGGIVVDVLDYKDTNKFKTVRSLSGHDNNGNGEITLFSSLWRSTSAITSIKITTIANFAQYTSFALYGIKG